MKGIDVSDNNAVRSWAQVRSAGYAFAFVKTTQGESFVSPTGAAQILGAGNVGLTVGAYHFADSTGSLTAQIDNFLAHTPSALPMYALDVEGSFISHIGADLTAWCNAFLRSVRTARPHADLYLYTNCDVLAGRNWSSVASVAKLWLANPSNIAVPPSAFGTPTIVQHAAAQVPGVIGPVDIDSMITTEDIVSTEKTYRVSDYRTPDPKEKTPYTVRTLTEGDILAQSYIMLTQLTEKLVRS